MEKLDTKKEISIVKGQATKVVNAVAEMVIQNDEQYSFAATKRIDLNEARKEIEKTKRKILDPLNEARNEVMSLFKPVEVQVTGALNTLDGKLRAYDQVKAAAARAKEEELRAEIASGEKDVAEAVSEISEVQSKPEVHSAKSGKKLVERRIPKLNVFDATLIPREYLVVDNVAVRAALLAGKSVPGARMDEEVSYS